MVFNWNASSDCICRLNILSTTCKNTWDCAEPFKVSHTLLNIRVQTLSPVFFFLFTIQYIKLKRIFPQVKLKIPELLKLYFYCPNLLIWEQRVPYTKWNSEQNSPIYRFGNNVFHAQIGTRNKTVLNINLGTMCFTYS